MDKIKKNLCLIIFTIMKTRRFTENWNVGNFTYNKWYLKIAPYYSNLVFTGNGYIEFLIYLIEGFIAFL